MARTLVRTSSQYLIHNAAPVLDFPLSIACWFRLNDVTTLQHLVALNNSITGYGFYLQAAGTAGGDPILAATYNIASSYATSTAGYTAATWYHGCAVIVGQADRRVYLNGGNKGTSAGAKASPSVDRATIGSNALAEFPLDGAIGEVAIYNTWLTDAEAALFHHRRYSALKIRPQNIAAYWPLRHGDNADWMGRYGMSPVNTPSDTASPPIVYPERDDPVWGLVLPRYRPRRYWVLGKAYVRGTTTWGHDTGVTETNIRDFSGNWTGTGTVDGAGDNERIELSAGEYMESEVVNTGSYLIELDQNYYSSGDDVTLKYRHGASEAACKAAVFGAYSAPFDSLGYVQIRLESTL